MRLSLGRIWNAAAPSSRPPATLKSFCTWWRTLPNAPSRARCAMRCCNWKAPFLWFFWRRIASLWLATRTVSGGRKCYVFASETCAFDLINAVYLHDVEPGEMVIVGPEGITHERYAPVQQLAQCAFEHVYFSRPD